MTLADSFPRRLTKVDSLTRPDHSYLTEGDHCYFLGEYTARKGYAYSATNDLVLNLKKSVDRRGRPEWRHKQNAIREVAAALRAALGEAIARLTFVPIPPSKAKDDPLYDNRITKMLRAMGTNPPPDVREIVYQSESLDAAHDSDNRPSPADLRRVYRIDGALCEPPPERIAIVDDVLTTGAHFKAVQLTLAQTFPTVGIVGLFVARRTPNTTEFEEVFGSS